MKVAELVAALDIVAPTLRDNDKIPIEQHFWFIGDKVVTFNDRLGMQAPCPLGGLDLTAPSVLRDLLKASYQNGTVEFAVDIPKGKTTGDFTVFVNNNEANFQTYSVADAILIFSMPTKLVSPSTLFANKLGKVQQAIEVCLLSAGTDMNWPERCGITLISEDEGLAFYGFNNDSIARCVLDGEGGKLPQRITVPTQFWTIFQNLTKGKDIKEAKADVTVSLGKDQVVARVGEVFLFSKTLPVEAPSPLRKVFDDHYSKAVQKNLLPISSKLQRAIARAIVLAGSEAEPATTFTVDGGKLLLETNGSNGQGSDELDFDHPDTAPLVLHPHKLAAVESFEHVAIGPRSVVLAKADRVFMVSGKGKRSG